MLVANFEINDRRGSRSGGTPVNLSRVEANLRSRGFALPSSPIMARKIVEETAESASNRSLTSSMRHTGSARTASTQIAIPKIRQPMSSLKDKNIPFDTTDTKELKEIRRWARLFYSTHDLVPLLVDIYSKFPLTGMEFKSKDPKIKDFYESMFMDTLDYEEFLQDLGREFFISGEVNSLGHFDETLGVFSSEEILNPDSLNVSKSMFVRHERVQLMVKDMVEALRQGAMAGTDDDISQSERLEKNWEYCCTPETKVLTADLNWVPVRTLAVGDEIIGFDEYPLEGHHGRSWRGTRVTATSIINAPTFEVATSGPSVTCTGAHMWLVDKKSQGMKWVRTDALKAGDKIRYMNTWEVEDTADIGYVSGIFDGEGELYTGGSYNLSFSQLPGPVLDKAVEILERHKFRLTFSNHPSGTTRVRIAGGVTEIMRCLGLFQPVRLLSKFRGTLDDRRLTSQAPVEVVSVEDRGLNDVVALATSSKTLIADGMYSHNTQLVENFPEIIQAAAMDDGLDISDALISRIVNKVQPWDLRGTPHLLRSFRTLMMEESLNAAQDAVADRLYSPLILATLGSPDLGDGVPWIPDPEELDDLRDTMQQALAADFRLMVHNFGLKVESVFGREAVPRFDTDYNRIDKKLMQAWGIGEALISGGTAAGGAYASSALNREFVTNMMSSFQKAVKKHIRKRCEIIAEAQGHYDYDVKGGVRTPIMREIVEFDEETGENYTRKVPKFLIPEIQFSTLNLRDETQERSFLQQLRQAGVPIADTSMAVNIPIEFEEELEKSSEEKVQKLLAEAQAMDKAYKLCIKNNWPVPPELARYMAAGPQLEKEQSGADTEAAGAEQAQQLAENPALALEMEKAGQPALPGMPAPGAPAPGQPPAAGGAAPPAGLPGAGATPPGLSPGGGGAKGAPSSAGPSGGGAVGGGSDSPPGGAQVGGEGGDLGISMDNGIGKPQLKNDKPAPGFEDIPINQPILDVGGGESGGVTQKPTLVPRNRTRPEESDEHRKTQPKKATFGQAPSSYGASKRASTHEIESAMARLASPSQTVRELVDHDEFFNSLNRQGYREQIRADIEAIYPAVQVDSHGPRLASNDANLQESFTVLSEMVEQYAETFGWTPEWA